MSLLLKNFVECDKKLLNEILLWRNHKDVRENSFNKNIINMEEHIKFIKSLKNDITKKYFIVLKDNEQIGVISFTNINQESAYAGYYKNPYIEKKGIGDILLNEAVSYAATVLNIKYVYMEAFINNTISQHCILKQGFIEIERNTETIKYLLRLS